MHFGSSRGKGGALILALLYSAHPVLAQIKYGNWSANLAGTASGGYTADSGTTGSDHGLNAGGNATLSGSYFNPNFLSFIIQPFYNQSWANSDYQSILQSSGVTASSSIFGGSNFPGSVSYSKTFNSSGTFGFPGLSNYTEHGDSDAFNIGWSEHLPNVPVVSVNYQQGDSENSLYGAGSDIVSDFHGFNANLNDRIAGFIVNAGYRFLDNHLNLPSIPGLTEQEASNSTSNSYFVGIGHTLPFHGSFSATAGRSDVSEDYLGGSYNTTLDNLGAGISFVPTDRLNVGANAQYTDNLLGSLYQPLQSAGAIVAEPNAGASSHSLDVTGYGNYSVPAWHLMVSGTDEYRDQTLFGTKLTSDATTGSASYSNTFFGGFLNATGAVTRSSVTPSNETRLGYTTILNYTREIRGWSVAGSFSYAQDAETLLISYTTNSYGYSGSVSRKFHRTSRWAIIGSGAKTSLTEASGSSSSSETVSTALNLRKLSLSAAYSRSTGSAILTGAGLTATSIILPVLAPTGIVLYGGHAYSAAVGANPFHGLTLSASYALALSNTDNDSISSSNRTEQLNARVQYLVRKIYFQAGYLRLAQGFSAAGTPPVTINSIYVGLARWFNFF